MLFALCNLVLCALDYGIAYRENRFTHEQLGPNSIPYVWHCGMWADWIIITAVAYLAYPYSKDWSSQTIIKCLLISGSISIIAHIAWANMQTLFKDTSLTRQDQDLAGYLLVATTICST